MHLRLGDERTQRPLVAAALYHDLVFDSQRHDNELRSAVLCRSELSAFGISDSRIISATDLILETQYHQSTNPNADSAMMLDADLFILGSKPEDYAAYVSNVRMEYSHVSDADWRKGRGTVMTAFLRRRRIFIGNWAGRDIREEQARENIRAEIDRHG